MRHSSTPKSGKRVFPVARISIVLAVVVVAGVLMMWSPWQHPAGVPAPLVSTPPLSSALANLSRNTAGGSAPVDPMPATNDLAGLLAEGAARLERGDPEGALRMYAHAMNLKPDDEEVHFNTAFALARLGKTNEAILAYTEALRILPDYAEAHINLGNLLVGLRRHNEAMGHFSTALKVNPESSSAMNNLGRCLAELGHMKEAVIQFSEAIRAHPEYLEARFNLAGAQSQLGNYDEAISLYEELLRMEPGFLPARSGLERARAKKAAAKQP